MKNLNLNQKKKQQQSDLTQNYKEIGPYLGLGTQLAATIVLMFFIQCYVLYRRLKAQNLIKMTEVKKEKRGGI